MNATLAVEVDELTRIMGRLHADPEQALRLARKGLYLGKCTQTGPMLALIAFATRAHKRTDGYFWVRADAGILKVGFTAA